jgi:hypothetical protein
MVDTQRAWPGSDPQVGEHPPVAGARRALEGENLQFDARVDAIPAYLDEPCLERRVEGQGGQRRRHRLGRLGLPGQEHPDERGRCIALRRRP